MFPPDREPSLSLSLSFRFRMEFPGNEGRQCRSTGQITARSDTDSRDCYTTWLSLSLSILFVESNRIEGELFRSRSIENFKNGVEYLVIRFTGIELYLQTGSMSRRNSNDKRRGRGETCYARIIYPREDREGRDLVRRERYVIRGVVG